MCATRTLADFSCAQPALLPTFLSATRTLIDCFMRAAHLICRLVNFFSVFIVFSQRLLKYSRSIRQPRLFCTPMFLRVHAATFPALWATAIRDQVLTRNRLTARGNYMTARHEKKFYMHSLMLGFSPVLLQAFSAMQGFTPNLISCISFYNIFLCLLHRRSDQEHSAGRATRPALRLGGWTPKTTRCGFHGLPGSQARGLDAAKLLDADSCEDRRQEKLYTAYHDFWILYSKSWNLDSRFGGCVSVSRPGGLALTSKDVACPNPRWLMQEVTR